ncbi:MAG: heat-inducible transcription repressor HrcA [Thermodesulfobacteria bacterium]|nr:heat-inducible transcription repressor HrcA [Thermodesulfobacteriota bacterium]
MSEKFSISERKKEILKQVVNSYIETAEPVGSRVIAKRSSLGLSSATIRNCMADLEDAGLLFQPHTSAGRLPTEEGLKFFVKNLMDKIPLSWGEQVAIEKEMLQEVEDFSDILKKAAQLLASLTGYTAVVSAPSELDERLEFIEFVNIKPGVILVVMVTVAGTVRNQLIRIKRDIPQSTLERFSAKMNRLLKDHTLGEIRQKLIEAMEEDKKLCENLLTQLVPAEHRRLSGKLYIDGKLNLLDEPEFAHIPKIKSLLEALEEKHLLLRLLDKCLAGEELQIFIGKEVDYGVPECGMVVAPYEKEDHPVGSLGVLGPMRMNYPKVVSLVEYIAAILSSRAKEM